MTSITVRNIQNLPSFAGLTLIAGADGLDRPVQRCGILDYEYDPTLGDRFYNTNFQPGQFTLTSLLFAKDDEFLVMNAVKNLITRGCCALVIRNVFDIPIHKSVLRYAGSQKFPVFLLKDPKLYFEDIIYVVTDLIQKVQGLDGMARKADAMLASTGGDAERLRLAKEMNPSFLSHVVCAYFYAGQPFGQAEFLAAERAVLAANVLASGDALFWYKNGMVLVHTADAFARPDAAAMLAPYLATLQKVGQQGRTGVGGLHYNLACLQNALRECLFAARFAPLPHQTHTAYDELGSLQLFMAQAPDEPPFQYAHVVKPLVDHDAENGTKLLQTAVAFVQCQGEIEHTAARLGQHKNTVRYRLDAAARLLGQSPYARAGYELLALGVKAYIAKTAAACFGTQPYYWENQLFG